MKRKPIFAHGNMKLPRSTIIFNITSAKQCPARKKKMCTLANPERCYARKGERLHPSVLPYRKRQATFWTKCTAKQFVERFLQSARRNTTHLRLNEAGDFKDQSCVVKAEQVAKMLSTHGIRTYCYTARKDLDFSGAKYLVVNGSGFMVHNEFRITSIPKGFVCPGDCRLCDVCTKKNRKLITTKLH